MLRSKLTNLVCGLAVIAGLSAFGTSVASAQSVQENAYNKTFDAYADAQDLADEFDDDFQSGGWSFYNEAYWANVVEQHIRDAVIHVYYSRFLGRSEWLDANEDLESALDVLDDHLLMAAQDSQPWYTISDIYQLRSKIQSAMYYTSQASYPFGIWTPVW